jgi:hypothetical protein
MWGYGVDPPADINPHLDLALRISARPAGIAVGPPSSAIMTGSQRIRW